MNGIIDAEFVAANAADYDVLIEGVEYFLALEKDAMEKWDTSALRDHYKAHPEDGLCEIYTPKDRRMVSCKRVGIDAIYRIARRLVLRSSSPEDLSVQELAEIISENILQVAIDGITEDEKLTEILLTYVTKSEEKHSSRGYHFPCILTHAKLPHRVCFGPVTFTTTEEFVRTLAEQKQQGILKFEADVLLNFQKEAGERGWVASVGIPRCAQETSRQRAENVIETALGLLKAFIGLGHSMGVRLPHVAPAQNRETCFLTQDGAEINWIWQGRALEGALVEDGWFSQIPLGFRNSASHLLHAALVGRRSDIANRVIDAIRWFSDASFEATAGVQIVKWVVALERLTTTGNFDTHVFCKRVALLASEELNETDIAEAYRATRRAYQLRCDVIHGAASQDDFRFLEASRAVHDLARMALLSGLSVHCALNDSGKASDKEDLIKFFVKTERPFAPLFHALKKEFAGIGIPG
jgi:hypothetical protein